MHYSFILLALLACFLIYTYIHFRRFPTMESPLQPERFKETLHVNPNYRPILHERKVKLFKTQDHQVYFEDYNWHSSLIYVVPKFKPQNYKSTVYVFPKDENEFDRRLMSGDYVTNNVIRFVNDDVTAVDVVKMRSERIVDPDVNETTLVNGAVSEMDEKGDKLQDVITDVYVNKKALIPNQKPPQEIQGDTMVAAEITWTNTQPKISYEEDDDDDEDDDMENDKQENDDILRTVIEDVYINRNDKGNDNNDEDVNNTKVTRTISSKLMNGNITCETPEERPAVVKDNIKHKPKVSKQPVKIISKQRSEPVKPKENVKVSPPTKETPKMPSPAKETQEVSSAVKATPKVSPATKETPQSSVVSKETPKFSPVTKEAPKSSPVTKATPKGSSITKETTNVIPATKTTSQGSPVTKATPKGSLVTKEITKVIPATKTTSQGSPVTKATPKGSSVTKETTKVIPATKATSQGSQTNRKSLPDQSTKAENEDKLKDVILGIYGGKTETENENDQLKFTLNSDTTVMKVEVVEEPLVPTKNAATYSTAKKTQVRDERSSTFSMTRESPKSASDPDTKVEVVENHPSRKKSTTRKTTASKLQAKDNRSFGSGKKEGIGIIAFDDGENEGSAKGSSTKQKGSKASGKSVTKARRSSSEKDSGVKTVKDTEENEDVRDTKSSGSSLKRELSKQLSLIQSKANEIIQVNKKATEREVNNENGRTIGDSNVNAKAKEARKSSSDAEDTGIKEAEDTEENQETRNAKSSGSSLKRELSRQLSLIQSRANEIMRRTSTDGDSADDSQEKKTTLEGDAVKDRKEETVRRSSAPGDTGAGKENGDSKDTSSSSITREFSKRFSLIQSRASEIMQVNKKTTESETNAEPQRKKATEKFGIITFDEGENKGFTKDWWRQTGSKASGKAISKNPNAKSHQNATQKSPPNSPQSAPRSPQLTLKEDGIDRGSRYTTTRKSEAENTQVNKRNGRLVRRSSSRHRSSQLEW